MTANSKLSAFLAASLLYLPACGDMPTEQVEPSLVGVWKLVAFEDGNQAVVPSGNWVFFDDGFMALDLQFTYEDGSQFFAATGFFEPIHQGVILKIRRSTTVWAMSFQANEVTLRQTAPVPASGRMTLERY